MASWEWELDCFLERIVSVQGIMYIVMCRSDRLNSADVAPQIIIDWIVSIYVSLVMFQPFIGYFFHFFPSYLANCYNC